LQSGGDDAGLGGPNQDGSQQGAGQVTGGQPGGQEGITEAQVAPVNGYPVA
jgi:hypothetical protein